MSQQDSLKQSKINIDSDEKLVAYNNFHDYARKLTEESIKINALAKQVNFNLCCIVRRRKILEAKKKCIDEFALNVYGEEGPKIFSSDIVDKKTYFSRNQINLWLLAYKALPLYLK